MTSAISTFLESFAPASAGVGLLESGNSDAEGKPPTAPTPPTPADSEIGATAGGRSASNATSAKRSNDPPRAPQAPPIQHTPVASHYSPSHSARSRLTRSAVRLFRCSRRNSRDCACVIRSRCLSDTALCVCGWFRFAVARVRVWFRYDGREERRELAHTYIRTFRAVADRVIGSVSVPWWGPTACLCHRSINYIHSNSSDCLPRTDLATHFSYRHYDTDKIYILNALHNNT